MYEVYMEKKERFSISLDTDLILQISTESAKRGQTKSYFVEKCIKTGISVNPSMTIAEKYRWNLSTIKDSLDTLLSSIGIKYNGDIVKAFSLIYSLPVEFFNTEYQYSMVRLGVMELLNSIQNIDKQLYESICDVLAPQKFPKDLKISEISELNMG